DLRGALAQLVAQRLDLRVGVQGRALAGLPQLLDPGLQVGDGLFEVEVVRVHADQLPGQRAAGQVGQSSRRAPTYRAVRNPGPRTRAGSVQPCQVLAERGNAEVPERQPGTMVHPRRCDQVEVAGRVVTEQPCVADLAAVQVNLHLLA